MGHIWAELLFWPKHDLARLTLCGEPNGAQSKVTMGGSQPSSLALACISYKPIMDMAELEETNTICDLAKNRPMGRIYGAGSPRLAAPVVRQGV